MAEYLDSLDPAAFFALPEMRKDALARASGTLSEHCANKLAAELHPPRQFLVIKDIVVQNERCKTYVFAPDTGKGTERLAYFGAGQFVSVKVDIGGHMQSRPYSLVSSPSEALRGEYAVTVKGTGGSVSEYVVENWRIGDSVEVSAPLGNFTYEPLRDAKHVVGVAGGSGVTPFVSLAKAVADGDEDCSLTLLCGYRRFADALHVSELAELSGRCEKIKVVYVIADERAEGCERGFINAGTIRKYAPTDEYSIFVCGPRALHYHIDKEAEKLGLEKKYVRHELLGEAFLPAGEGRPVTITVTCRGRSSKARGYANESILRILEENGVEARARCRSGECGFCRAKLLAGEVIIPEETDRRRLADEPHGYIHPCCTYPLGDIAIEIGPGENAGGGRSNATNTNA